MGLLLIVTGVVWVSGLFACRAAARSAESSRLQIRMILNGARR